MLLRLFFVLSAGLLLGFAFGSRAAPGEERRGEQRAEQRTRRIPEFENEHLKVWKTIIHPNQPLSMHRHENGRAIVAIRGGTLQVVRESGEEKAMTWESGRAYWLDADPPGELHGDVNRGAEPIEVIVLELQR